MRHCQNGYKIVNFTLCNDNRMIPLEKLMWFDVLIIQWSWILRQSYWVPCFSGTHHWHGNRVGVVTRLHPIKSNLVNDFARSFVMLSHVRNCDLCSSDVFYIVSYTCHAVYIGFWLEMQTLSSSLRCHFVLFTVTQTQNNCLILTWQKNSFKPASCFIILLLVQW